MKFRVGDQVLVTSGKDKGKKGVITSVVPQDNSVVVEGMNVYVKHVKPIGDRAGQRLHKERPLATAKVAILNDKGQPDRVRIKVEKDGTKVRVFAKTNKVIEDKKEAKTK